MYLFLSHLPHVETERRLIGGKEELCLIIPTKTNQIKQGKQGNWMMICRLHESEFNSRSQTHDVQLTFLYPEDLSQKDEDWNFRYRTEHLGRVYVHGRDYNNGRIDYTNRADSLSCEGRIILSDIPKNLIFRNAENARRYLDRLVFRALHSNDTIYTGFICIDDIPCEDIKIDMQTGKRYIDVKFVKLQKLDTYMNTHQLIIARDDGTEIEIGRFREWEKQEQDAVKRESETISESEGTKRMPPPDEISGIRF